MNVGNYSSKHAVFAVWFLRLLAALPLPLNHALGAAAGWWLGIVPNGLRRISRINLERCLPELTARQRHKLLRRSLRETGKTLTETGPLWCRPRERLLPLVREVTGEEAVQAAYAAGRGVIFVTPHLGSWEMAGLYAAARYPMTTFYRPPRLAALEPLIREGRERTGARLAATDARGIRRLYRTLEEGATVGILPDQEPGRGGGRFAPFFGIPAYTMTLLSRLARRTGAAVFFAWCPRLPGGRGYHLHFRPAPEAVGRGSLDESVAAVNEALESCVRVLPEQYQWSYRRFRTRPPGEAPFY